MEGEQEELDAAIVREQAELDAFNADTDRADQFLELVRRYTDFSVLDSLDGIQQQRPDCPGGDIVAATLLLGVFGGRLTEKRFKLLSEGYEREQEELDAAIVREQAELDAFNAATLLLGVFGGQHIGGAVVVVAGVEAAVLSRRFAPPPSFGRTTPQRN